MSVIRAIVTFALLVNLAWACTKVVKENYGWRKVRNKYPVHLNFSNNELEIKTDSRLGSHRKIRLVFYNQKMKEAGGVFVKFSQPPQYKIGWCSHWMPLHIQLNTTHPRIWRVALQGPTVIVRVTSGGSDVTRFDDVIKFTPSDETCERWPHWDYYWAREITRVKFTKHLDRASDFYRVQIPAVNWAAVPKGLKFEMDLTRDPLEVFTGVKLGSDALISVMFYDNETQIAGGVQIKLTEKPRYSIPMCHKMKPIPWNASKFLRSLGKVPLVWSFTRSQAGITVSANGADILQLTLSDSTCVHKTSWKTFWNRKVHRVMFTSRDSASRHCRVEEKSPTQPPKPKRQNTWTPPKGNNWYGTWAPPTEEPTKHSPTVSTCWVRGVRPVNSNLLLTTLWVDETHCQELCKSTSGCHVAFKHKVARREPGSCELYGRYDYKKDKGLYNFEKRYDLERPRDLYYSGRSYQRLAERKCFDPQWYNKEGGESPCGEYSFECKERCVEIAWRCDGERDCKGGEDEEGCTSFHGPFCGPGLWKCPDYHLCPEWIDLDEDARCNRCIKIEYKCDGYPLCYFGEDERDCPDTGS